MRTSSITFVVFALLLSACADDDVQQPGKDCPAGEIRCGDVCIDPLADPRHCGACDEVCAGEDVCSAGVCASSCDAGTDCNGACVDTSTDDENCGACGSACGTGMACAAGACACVGGLESCGGSCVDLDSDRANCGACGTACATGEACSEGACVVECADESTLCGGACVNTATDGGNCGGCGVVCTGGMLCADAACACPAGEVECGGSCIDPASDDANCGSCGNVCTPGDNATAASCEAGVCASACAPGFGDCDGQSDNGCEADLDDTAHCGSCGNACDDGAYCTSGICCGAADLVCDGACIDPLGDDAHCGGCGLSCAGWPQSSGGSCLGGACELACAGSFDDCNGDRMDGCERDLASDRLHCGACGTVCPSICGGGACLTMTAPAQIFGHTCMLFSDGSVRCWGLNDFGQVGDGTTIRVTQGGLTTPHHLALPVAEELATGPYHSCIRTAEGGVVCWGKNEDGQLGAGNAAVTLAPQTVLAGGAPLAGVTQLALTDSSTCALLTGGQVQCWGNGADGRLGNGGIADSLEPVHVTDGTAALGGVAEIAAGAGHVCARLNDGSVRCWGQNVYGQLGVGESGSGNQRTVAAAIPGLSGVDQVVAAGFRTCARIGGTAKCWGQNISGQVGDGTSGASATRTSPVDVLNVTTAVRLHIGGNHGFALLAGGGAVGWGMNYSGQLNSGSTPGLQPTPAPVLDPNHAQPWTGLQAIVAGGQSYSCAIDAAGELLCWGLNTYGQLGIGTLTAEPRPVPVQW